jgi:hypothetical protein
MSGFGGVSSSVHRSTAAVHPAHPPLHRPEDADDGPGFVDLNQRRMRNPVAAATMMTVMAISIGSAHMNKLPI